MRASARREQNQERMNRRLRQVDPLPEPGEVTTRHMSSDELEAHRTRLTDRPALQGIPTRRGASHALRYPRNNWI